MLGVEYGGLDSYNRHSNEFDHESITHEGDTITSINKLLTDKKGQLFIASDEGLLKRNPQKPVFDLIIKGEVLDVIEGPNNQIFVLTQDAIFQYEAPLVTRIVDNGSMGLNKIFIDSKGMLYGLKPYELFGFTKIGTDYSLKEKLKVDQLVTLMFADSPIIEDSKQRIWIGGSSGITLINSDRTQSQFLPYESLFKKNLKSVQALSFFEDAHNNFWIGTNKGLAIISTFNQRTQPSFEFPHADKLTDVRAIAEINNRFLLGANSGLYLKMNEEKSKLILDKKIFKVYKSSRGEVYLKGNGVYQIDTVSYHVRKILNTGIKGWSLVEDQKNNLWTVDENELIKIHVDSNKVETFDFHSIPTLPEAPRLNMLIDSRGRLWLCTLKSGVYVLNDPQNLSSTDTPEFTNINHEANNKNSLSDKLATCLVEGVDGTIWVGTDTGLNSIDPITFEVKRFLKKDGLRDEKIMALLVDDYGNLWGSTVGNGIFKLNNTTKEFSFIRKEDGLISNNFLLSSAFKNNQGILFFGSDSGVQRIDPKLFETFQPPEIDFFFTDLIVSTASLGESDETLSNLSNEINLKYNERSFSVHYTALNYHLPKNTQYSYRIKELNDVWVDNGSERNIKFNGLSPGSYTLEVLAKNQDVNFKNDKIKIGLIISPPWWGTNVAYFIYLLLFVFIFYTIYHFMLNRKLLENERARLIELDAFKTRLFANITHELKTPLTMILGMSNNLLKKNGTDRDKYLRTITRNTEELNNMVDQLLDVSKLSEGKLTVQETHGCIITFLKSLTYSLKPLANAKELELSIDAEVDFLYVDLDFQKLKHIYNNLLTNAIKYTPIKGTITVRIGRFNDYIFLEIGDNGIGIKSRDIKNIFTRFVRANEQARGTGIGLSFTRELVELMKGTITVKSEIGKGSVFTVNLPFKNSCSQSRSIASYGKESLRGIASSSLLETMPLVQIVEDNLEICSYLELILKEQYRLKVHYNGEDGISSILNNPPDLIITDIGLPIRNGLELCATVKDNTKTNHIPIIILTGNSDIEKKREGIKLGADAYLRKPFDEKELLLLITNLLDQRVILRNKFGNYKYWEEGSKDDKSSKAFLLKARSIIENQMNNPKFGVVDLCHALGVSRSHLHRKLKKLANVSTTSFINSVKLSKAKQLLEENAANVSEVAYQVGFDDPSYFSKQFSKEFGYPPSSLIRES